MRAAFPLVLPKLKLPYGGDAGLYWETPRNVSERRKARASRSLRRILDAHPAARKRYIEGQRGIQKPPPKPKLVYGFDPASKDGKLTALDVSDPKRPRIALVIASPPMASFPGPGRVYSQKVEAEYVPPRVLSKEEVKALTKTTICDCGHTARDHVTDGCFVKGCACDIARVDLIRKAVA